MTTKETKSEKEGKKGDAKDEKKVVMLGYSDVNFADIDKYISHLDNNGTIEVGISAGADAGLPDDQRLRVMVDNSAKARALAAAAEMAYGKDVTKFEDVLEVACAFHTVALGLVQIQKGKIIDGDAVILNPANRKPLPPDWEKAILAMDFATAIGVIVAGKVTWWAMNHHVGQNKNAIEGYSKKFFSVKFGEKSESDYRSIIYRCSHRASTRCVFEALGRGIKVTTDYPIRRIIPSADVKLRLDAAPAGTHRGSVAYAAFWRLSRSGLLPYCPNAINMFPHIKSFEHVMANPIRYHIGSSYLIGKREQYDDQVYAGCLGRLSSFIQAVYGNSTLAKSPHMMKPENHEDFDSSWATFLNKFKMESARGKLGSIPKSLTSSGSTSPDILLIEFNSNFKGTAHQRDLSLSDELKVRASSKVTQEIKDNFGIVDEEEEEEEIKPKAKKAMAKPESEEDDEDDKKSGSGDEAAAEPEAKSDV